MVVRTMRKTSIPSHIETPEIFDVDRPLPRRFWDELEELDFHYPGWEKDYATAAESFHRNDEHRFKKTLKKLKDKQRVYDDYRAFTRLNELAILELAYPGSEEDKQEVERYHLENPPSAETDAIFKDKLEGLKNKDKLCFGDRTHPNIVALDALELTYPGWEEDYQNAVTAHCEMPEAKFGNAYHLLSQRQRLYENDRSHWRLVQLDKLKLSYQGWQADVSEVEHWHLHHCDTPENDAMFAEVIEGMKDQQLIYLGWDHDDNASEKSEESDTNRSVEAQVDFYKIEHTVDHKEVEQMRECYDSITESLKVHEKTKERLRSNSPSARRSPSPTSRGGVDYRSQPEISKKKFSSRDGTPPRYAPPKSIKKYSARARERQSGPKSSIMEEREMPPKQIKFGHCVVCCSRPKTHVFVPCGHLCACAACTDQTMKTSGSCPICRKLSEGAHRVFLT